MDKFGLKILQWNCRGIYRKLPEFKRFIFSMDRPPEVIILQETHLVDTYSPSLPNYKLFRQDKSIRSGGLAIFVHGNLPVTPIDISPSPRIELQALKICNIYIYNVYIQPTTRLEDSDLNFLNNLPPRTIVLGDFNAHHQCWSTRDNLTSNQRGQKIYECIEQNRLVLMNTSRPTQINLSANTVSRWSLLDLTLVTSDVASRCETVVTDQLIGSDHCIIITTVNSRVQISETETRKWSIGKANWKEFSRLVDINLTSGVDLELDIEEMNSKITRSIISAAETTIPRSRNIGKIPVPWWNVNCERAIKRKRAAFMKMKRTFNFDDVIDFKRKRAECRRTIQSAKRQFWEKFCASLDMRANAKRVWRVAKSLNGVTNSSSIPSLSLDNQVIITEDKSKADALAEVFKQTSGSANYVPNAMTNYVVDTILESGEDCLEMDDPINRLFSLAELQAAISSRKNSSPGQDNICYPMLKHLSRDTLNRLLDLYNSSWTKGTTPTDWGHSIIVPILKNGKDPSSPTSYRPISLTSHLGKVMEVMVAMRLRWFLETRNLLHTSQSGFRHKRSTLDHILRLHDTVYKAFINGGSVMAVFLDIAKAYDTVWRDGLLTKLYQLGIRGIMLRWIRSMISNRTFQVRIGNKFSDEARLENGIPQGSVISPLLFAVMVNDLPEEISTDNGLFADDVAFWESGTSISRLLNSAQSTLNKINEWCLRWGFNISKTKSVALLFTKKRKIPPLRLYLDASLIQFVDQFKYLGVIFDRKLSYKDHIEYVAAKCARRINLLKMISGTLWGASKKTLLILYRTLIRPVLDYGMPAYFFAPKCHLEKLEKNSKPILAYLLWWYEQHTNLHTTGILW